MLNAGYTSKKIVMTTMATFDRFVDGCFVDDDYVKPLVLVAQNPINTNFNMCIVFNTQAR